jgi:hypothetical protein
MNVWGALSLLVVAIVILVDNRRGYKRRLSTLEVEHQNALRSERASFAADQSISHRRIGILEDQLAKAHEALSGTIRIPMQSIRNTFLMHDFTIASLTPEQIEYHLRIELERSLRAIEEKAKKELMVVFTDPILTSFDDLSGKAYTVTVGAFPKFVLGPDGSFEIEGHRVEITMLDDDGHPVETYHPVKLSFTAHPRIR